MIACLDVDYRGEHVGVAACLVAQEFYSSAPLNVYAATLSDIAPYESGAFYKRELPCLLAVLAKVREAIDYIVVDSYVWLDNERTRQGMGAHLYYALHERVPVIGVAKTYFEGTNEAAVEVLRGQSRAPLFVSSIGVEVAWAAQQVRMMHGEHRLPTLLREVDQMCRNF